MNTLRRSLLFTGALSLLMLAGLILVLLGLHQVGLINFWQFPLKHVAVFFIFGSVACFLSALVLRLVQRSPKAPHRQSPAKSRHRRRWLSLIIVVTISINGPAYLLAYHMTHVHVPGTIGIGVPKPSLTAKPSDRGLDYVTHRIPISDSAWLEAWLVPTPAATALGTVVLFPGNLGTKSSQLISPAQTFTSLGYDCLLVDFQGVGGSSGNTVTIGMKEAQDVVRSLTYAQSIGLSSPTILYGVSMGSAAILRAIALENVTPDAVILELPFARMLNAIRSRLRHHHIPAFPTAELLLFWGSVQHGINGFGHNPVNFAKSVNCPTLLIHGEQDKWTTVAEIEALFANLTASKQLVISPDGGHHQLIGVDRPLWDASIANLLGSM
ncbi:MAG: alpha/beta fold hydrolase [Cyanobacteria bacterium J06559_3]